MAGFIKRAEISQPLEQLVPTAEWKHLAVEPVRPGVTKVQILPPPVPHVLLIKWHADDRAKPLA
jgi:hypothetical protein